MFQRFRFNFLSASWYGLILLQFVMLYQPAIAQSDIGDRCTTVASGSKARRTERSDETYQIDRRGVEHRATQCLARAVSCATVSTAEENQPTIATPLLADSQLIHAIQLNRAYHVKQLLNKGHHPNAVDSQGNPMLLLALYENAFDAAWILLEHPQIDINQANPHHETALMLACLKGQIKIVQAMIQQHHAQINQSGWTPLHYAASTGQLEITRFLLQHHAEVDARSPNGTTPLMMAARGGHIHVAKLLLDMGADVFLKNTIDLNAADFAERYHQTEIASGLRSRMEKLRALQH